MYFKLHNSSLWKRGFTFAEVLAALVFLAILVPVVVEALTLSISAAGVTERSLIAVELAENQLNDIVMNRTWQTGTTHGDFGTDWPNYQWDLSQTSWSQENMIQLTLQVHFEVQGRGHNVVLSTLVSSLAP